MPQTRCRHVTWRSSWFVGRLQVISGQRRPFLTWHVRALLSCFSVVLVPFMPPSLLGGSWDAFQIPHGPSYQARSLLPDWFSHDPRAPPCYQGDAAVTCQFRDAHRLVVAQNRIVKSFRCKARERESGTESAAVRAVKRKSISATCKSGAQLCVFGADRPLLFRGVAAQRPPGSLCVGKTSFCGLLRPFLGFFSQDMFTGCPFELLCTTFKLLNVSLI